MGQHKRSKRGRSSKTKPLFIFFWSASAVIGAVDGASQRLLGLFFQLLISEIRSQFFSTGQAGGSSSGIFVRPPLLGSQIRWQVKREKWVDETSDKRVRFAKKSAPAAEEKVVPFLLL
eukprot:Trichotokara_eunicae@DN2706_c0_g1_i1.p1